MPDHRGERERLRDLRRDLQIGKIDSLLWLVHFGSADYVPTCRDCADYKAGLCPGGWDPLECFRKDCSGKRSEKYLY